MYSFNLPISRTVQNDVNCKMLCLRLVRTSHRFYELYNIFSSSLWEIRDKYQCSNHVVTKRDEFNCFNYAAHLPVSRLN